MDAKSPERLRPNHASSNLRASACGLALVTSGFIASLYAVDSLNKAATLDRDIIACASELGEKPTEISAQQFPRICDRFADDFRQEHTIDSLQDTFAMPAGDELAGHYTDDRRATDPLRIPELVVGPLLMSCGVIIAGNSYKPTQKY